MEPSSEPEVKRVLVIDKQGEWRISTAQSLRELGFLVKEAETYTYTPEMGEIEGQGADLVLIGCPSIGRAERELLARILKDGRHVLIFSASLPWADMRSVFLAGVDDVTNKTYDQNRLLQAVTDVFANIASRSSFELAKRKA